MITQHERELLLAAKDGTDIYPAHINEGLDYLELERRGLVKTSQGNSPADGIDVKPLLRVTLTLPGREAVGLQGHCEGCGLYDHDLNTGLCVRCAAAVTQRAAPPRLPLREIYDSVIRGVPLRADGYRVGDAHPSLESEGC